MKYGWKSYDDPATYQLRLAHPLCTAERHAGLGVAAWGVACLVDGTPELWELVGHPPDTEFLIWGVCRECVEGLALEAGTTVEAGQL